MEILQLSHPNTHIIELNDRIVLHTHNYNHWAETRDKLVRELGLSFNIYVKPRGGYINDKGDKMIVDIQNYG